MEQAIEAFGDEFPEEFREMWRRSSGRARGDEPTGSRGQCRAQAFSAGDLRASIERLFSDTGGSKFLVADEVGLGKTRVALGLVTNSSDAAAPLSPGRSSSTSRPTARSQTKMYVSCGSGGSQRGSSPRGSRCYPLRLRRYELAVFTYLHLHQAPRYDFDVGPEQGRTRTHPEASAPAVAAGVGDDILEVFRGTAKPCSPPT